MHLKGSQTEKNLLKAFAGESQARNRYTYFAGQARKEGMIRIALQFEETANQEREHAKRFFSLLEGGSVEITASFPAGRIATTLENLQAAAAGEHEEYSTLYPSFAQVAQAEGFAEAAKLFEMVSVAEKQHERQFLNFADRVKNNLVFKSNAKVTWRCLNCGYIHEGTEAPHRCPACLHAQAFFELYNN